MALQVLRDDQIPGLEQLESGGIDVDFILVDPEPVAVEALRLKQLVGIFHHERVVEWRSELNVANMSRAIIDCQSTGRASGLVVKW